MTTCERIYGAWCKNGACSVCLLERRALAAEAALSAMTAERDGFRNGQDQVQHLFDLLWVDVHGKDGLVEHMKIAAGSLKDARRERDEAEARGRAKALAEVASVLHVCEWSSGVEIDGTCCPACGAWATPVHKRRHRPGCELAALLPAAPSTKEGEP